MNDFQSSISLLSLHNLNRVLSHCFACLQLQLMYSELWGHQNIIKVWCIVLHQTGGWVTVGITLFWWFVKGFSLFFVFNIPVWYPVSSVRCRGCIYYDVLHDLNFSVRPLNSHTQTLVALLAVKQTPVCWIMFSEPTWRGLSFPASGHETCWVSRHVAFQLFTN